MLLKKSVGRGSATRKYDLLTILGAHALAQDRGLQRQTLRLICLITARYNWQYDQLSVGQEEIARLWSVDPRTVKREMAALRQRGWLVERRAAARGRVTLYGLGIDRILDDTRAVWERVGPDLVARLGESDPPPVPPADGSAETAGARVIPFPQAMAPAGAGLWAEVARLLQRDDPAIFRVWFAGLSATEEAPDLVLQAPSGFHASYIKTHLAARIEAALQRLAPGMRMRIG
ncbi:MAG: hypothetical protein IAE87_18350 [Rhodobacteraceae bacterium]|jgi:hypothetical protein|nr:hypothetical protein [Paracoccaceae bacterium]